MLYRMRFISCENLKHPGVKELSENGEKFDLVLIENFNTNCFMSFVHKLNVPFIDISTHQPMPWTIHNFRFPNEASFMPMLLTPILKPMNLFYRTMNTLSLYVSSALYCTIFHWKDQSIAEEIYGPDIPNVITINKNMSIFFVNTHYTLHGSFSYPPNVIEVGGIHIESKRKPLPQNIAKFLDEAHEGVLYFNLGSMIKMSTISKDKLNILIKVFRFIPRKVIWKWEQDDIPELPDNVMVQKWLPQYDILNHPNVKCYFGHGGLLGLTEGVQSGVPMILMPFYGDQYSNAAAAQTRGVAVILEFNDFTEEKLRNALDQNVCISSARFALDYFTAVIARNLPRNFDSEYEYRDNRKSKRGNNDSRSSCSKQSYGENAKRLSKAFKDRPASPLETAIWWTEYVARGNGLPYVKSEATTMAWHERYLVDVHAILLLFSLLALYVQYRVLCSGVETSAITVKTIFAGMVEDPTSSMTREVVESGRKEYKTTIPKNHRFIPKKQVSRKECLKKEVMSITKKRVHIRVIHEFDKIRLFRLCEFKSVLKQSMHLNVPYAFGAFNLPLAIGKYWEIKSSLSDEVLTEDRKRGWRYKSRCNFSGGKVWFPEKNWDPWCDDRGKADGAPSPSHRRFMNSVVKAPLSEHGGAVAPFVGYVGAADDDDDDDGRRRVFARRDYLNRDPGYGRANPSTIPLKIHRVIKGLYPVASKTGFITGEKERVSNKSAHYEYLGDNNGIEPQTTDGFSWPRIMVEISEST
ncbi:UDP-glucuronosyltransferase [Apis cerana cerana]|uniref:UDP-glucuronosyltransferase n=1 Tax=Apis cerana cerana TaxID=94128 RepID=A0A2A3EDW2_APICC|nr:UDP-glucuronosyltransferase [Apis cerana cerana]